MTSFGHFKIRNSYAFKKVDLDLKKKGLVRIVGRNGAGKSSLWNLFTFLYYGLTPLKQSKSDITLDDKDFLLESSFQKNGVDYWVAYAHKSKELNPLGDKYNTGFFLYRREADGTWKDISEHKAKDTQKLVGDLLGWSLDEWYGYVYLSQQASHKLINGTPAERQKYLSALFNLDPLDKISQDYARRAVALQEKVRQIDLKKNELEVVQRMLEGYGSKDDAIIRLGDAEIQIADLDQSLGAAQADQKIYEDLNKLREEAAKVSRSKESDEDLQAELTVLTDTQQEIRVLESKRTDNERQIREIKAKLAALPRAELPADYDEVMLAADISLDQENLRLKSARAADLYIKRFTEAPAFSPLPENYEAVLMYQDIDVNRTKAEIRNIESRPAPPAMNRPDSETLDELRMDLSNVKSKITFLHDRRAQLMIEGICPTCATQLDPIKQAEHRAKVDQEMQEAEAEQRQVTALLADMIASEKAWKAHDLLGPDRSAELPELKRAIEHYEEKQRVKGSIEANRVAEEYGRQLALSGQVTAIEAAITAYQKKVSYRDLKDKIRDTEMLTAQLRLLQETGVKFVESLENLPDPSAQLAVVNLKIKTNQQVAELEAKINLLQRNNPQVVEDLTQKISEMMAVRSQLVGTIAREQEKVDKILELDQQISKLVEEISSQESVYREQVKCEILAKAYGKAGKIRQGLLSKFARYLEDALACHTMRQLPEHRFQIQVDDGIGLQASKNGSAYYDVSTCSGGEKGALSSALLFALDDMLPPDRRSGLKIIDEAESAFDQERKVDFADYLLPEMKKRAETVIVISHTPIEDQTIFDRTWEVRDGQVHDVSGEVREFEE